jgi:hypothetical protein
MSREGRLAVTEIRGVHGKDVMRRSEHKTEEMDHPEEPAANLSFIWAFQSLAQKRL